MSYITFEEGYQGELSEKSYLERAIDYVLKRLNLEEENVHWVIFKDHLKLKVSGSEFQEQNVYGKCFKEQNEIWISTLAIEHFAAWGITNVKSFSMTEEDTNLLVNVIMNELAKINSGEQSYEELLASYQDLFYGENVLLALHR